MKCKHGALSSFWDRQQVFSANKSDRIDNTARLCLPSAMRSATSSLRRGASLLVALWLCAWLTPIVHQTLCTGHQHSDITCPICQLATTSVISAPPLAAPIPVRAVAQPLPLVWTPSPALLFQVEHPPRGPPPAVACV